MTSKRSAILFILISLLYILLSFYVYRGTSGHGFLHWDDPLYVVGNEHVQKLSTDNLWWMLTKYHANNWHPVSWLSHAIDVALWGNNPARHHQTNIFIHSLNSICLFFLALTLIRTANNKNNSDQKTTPDNKVVLASFLAGLLFLIHPQHVESVAWISERKDLLCALFFMLSIIAYLRFTLTGKSFLKTISMLLYIFSLMSKSMAVSLPLVLLILDYYPLRRLDSGVNLKNSLAERIKEKSVYILAAFATAIIAIISQYAGGAVRSLDELSLLSRFVNAANSLIFYIYKFLLPVNFSAYYPHPKWVLEIGFYSFLPIVIILAITIILVKANRKGNRLGLASLLYYFVTIFPVLGIVQVGRQAAADRYSYIPLLIFYILAGLFVQKVYAKTINRRLLKIPLYVTLAGVLFFLMNASQEQVQIWKNDKTLWKSVILQYPDTVSVAHANLGSAYFEEGNFALAESEYKRAININPKDIQTRLNLGLTLERLNKKEQATKLYNEILSTNVDSFWIFTKTGDAFFRLQNYEAAYSQYKNALKVNPDSDKTIIQVSRIHALSGEYVTAQNFLEIVLARNPDNIGANILMADIFNMQKKYRRAIEYHKKVLQIDPKNKQAEQKLNALMKKI